jgi:hypothetical protein
VTDGIRHGLRDAEAVDQTPVCKHCGCERIATLEQIEGLAGITFGPWREGVVEPDYDHDGYTDVLWDTSQSVGFTCRGCATTTRELKDLVVPMCDYKNEEPAPVVLDLSPQAREARWREHVSGRAMTAYERIRRMCADAGAPMAAAIAERQADNWNPRP